MKGYLGDGVYAQTNELDEVILTAEDGIDITNTIVLDKGVIKQLLRLLEECGYVNKSGY